jgi:hypothetical protein
MSEDKDRQQEEAQETEERPKRSYTREGLEEAGVGFLQALGDGLGVLLDQGRAEIEDIARSGKAQYSLVQAKRDRDLQFRKLGRALYLRWEAGELDIEGLDEVLGNIQELNGIIEDREASKAP